MRCIIMEKRVLRRTDKMIKRSSVARHFLLAYGKRSEEEEKQSQMIISSEAKSNRVIHKCDSFNYDVYFFKIQTIFHNPHLSSS